MRSKHLCHHCQGVKCRSTTYLQNPEAVEAAAFDHYAGHDCNDDPETE